MIEINLIPDVKQQLLNAQRIRATVVTVAIIVCLVAAGVVVALSAYVFGVQSVRGGLADTAIKDGEAELASVEDLSKVLTIQNQLTKIDLLNDEKKIDSRIFDVLGAIIPSGENAIQISNLKIDADAGSITIDGQAPNGYAALEVFKKTIAAANVQYKDNQDANQEVVLASDISTGNISYGEDSSGKKVLRFTISFIYAEELFASTVSDVAISIGNQGNVTDSYLGVPKSIFADRAEDLEEGE